VRVAVWWLFVLVICGAAYLYSPPVGAVSAAALQHSLAREVGGDTSLKFECTNRAPGIWRCPVHDPALPGSSIVYELKRDGRRCWTASQAEPGQGHLDVTAAACVGLRDQVRLDQRV
jgi:hypothetical protein